jgi:cyanophycinase
MRRKFIWTSVIALPILAGLFSTEVSRGFSSRPSSGPVKGTLIVSGGGFGSVVRDRFVSLSGGPDANFVYIPTASSSIKLDSGFIYIPPETDAAAANTKEFEQELAKMFGVKRMTVLHTRSRRTANSEAFVGPLRKSSGVWLSQGNAGRLADAYLDTLMRRRHWWCEEIVLR